MIITITMSQCFMFVLQIWYIFSLVFNFSGSTQRYKWTNRNKCNFYLSFSIDPLLFPLSFQPLLSNKHWAFEHAICVSWNVNLYNWIAFLFMFCFRYFNVSKHPQRDVFPLHSGWIWWFSAEFRFAIYHVYNV